MAMKTVWNGFKLKLVKPSFLGQFLFWNMFDISAKFLCLLINVCFRTVPILQHCMAGQRASKYCPSSPAVSNGLGAFFKHISVTLLFQISTQLYFISILKALLIIERFCISTFWKIIFIKITCVLPVLKGLFAQE